MASKIMIMAFSVFLVCFAEAKGELRFEKKKLTIAGKQITVEIADTPEKTAQGLMFRTSLGDNEGMLFVFDDVAPRSFWMKNTFIPLTIAFFDGNRKLVEFFDMAPVKSEMEINPPTYSSKASARYALEVPKGWIQKHKIPLGAVFQLK